MVTVLEQALADDANFTITSPFAVVPGGRAGEYAARATYTMTDDVAESTTILDAGWVIESSGGDGVGDVTVRTFSICVERNASAVNASQATCLDDGGLNRRVQSELFEKIESGSPEGASINIT